MVIFRGFKLYTCHCRSSHIYRKSLLRANHLVLQLLGSGIYTSKTQCDSLVVFSHIRAKPPTPLLHFHFDCRVYSLPALPTLGHVTHEDDPYTRQLQPFSPPRKVKSRCPAAALSLLELKQSDDFQVACNAVSHGFLVLNSIGILIHPHSKEGRILLTPHREGGRG